MNNHTIRDLFSLVKAIANYRCQKKCKVLAAGIAYGNSYEIINFHTSAESVHFVFCSHVGSLTGKV